MKQFRKISLAVTPKKSNFSRASTRFTLQWRFFTSQGVSLTDIEALFDLEHVNKHRQLVSPENESFKPITSVISSDYKVPRELPLLFLLKIGASKRQRARQFRNSGTRGDEDWTKKRKRENRSGYSSKHRIEDSRKRRKRNNRNCLTSKHHNEGKKKRRKRKNSFKIHLPF